MKKITIVKRSAISAIILVSMIIGGFVGAAPVVATGPTHAVVMVKDINTTGADSNPEYLTAVGSTLFFSAYDRTHGEELWASDGTVEGTVMVKDINPSGDSNPEYLTAVGSTLFFRAYSETYDTELWKSDGSAEGTVIVKDINLSFGSGSYPMYLTAAGSTLFFTAYNQTYGRELWKSDGTAEGTVMVKDINLSGDSNPNYLTAAGSTLFFTAYNETYGWELWKSDGTAEGTMVVKDIHPGSGNSYAENLAVLGSTLFFAAQNATYDYELWTSNGTAEGTVLLKDINPSGSSYPNHLTAVGSTLFFDAYDGTYGGELWKSDGTGEGTVMIKDICPGGGNSYIEYLTGVGSSVFFQAYDGTYGYELWMSNGTAEGTVLVKDICPGSEGSYPQYLTPVGSTLFFEAYDGTYGYELWASNGTPEGTFLVKDINTSGDSYPGYLTAVGSTLFFRANDGTSGYELWMSDGTAEGTALVRDINPGTMSSDPYEFGVMGSTLFFTAIDATDGRELWRSDGTEASTAMVKDICSGSGSSEPSALTVMGSTLFFSAYEPATGYELWRSDGTAAGTAMVKDIYPDSGSSYPEGLTVVGSTLFFRAYDDGTYGCELWKSNGTAEGTALVKDINPSGDSYPDYLTAVGNTLFFRAYEPDSGYELWKSDGTGAGTELVADVNPGSEPSYLSSLTVVGSTLFFTAYNATSGYELWASDGTESGTVMVKDINPGTGDSYPECLTAVGSMLFFNAYNETCGRELWKSDGSAEGTALVKDINTNGDSYPDYLTAVGSTLFFNAYNETYGRELWMSDGTESGTVMVKDINPGSEGSYPENIAGAGTTAFFAADDGTHGGELWTSDGTAEGTMMVKEIYPGSGGSYPGPFTSLEGTVIFGADDGTHGRELWKMESLEADTIVNGSFETGDYAGWTLSEFYPNAMYPDDATFGIAANGETVNPGDSTWDFYDGLNVTQGAMGLPITYNTTDGNYLAYILVNFMQSSRMYQDITLDASATNLTWDMWYTNHEGVFDPDYQYLAVYLRDTDDNILETLFKTTQGVDFDSIPMTSFSADVSAYAGTTVRLDIEQDQYDWYFDSAFDNFAVAGGTDPIVNGSFETGDYTGWTLLQWVAPSPAEPEAGTFGIAADGETINSGDSRWDFHDEIYVKQYSDGLPITYGATDGSYLAYILSNYSEVFRMYQDVTLGPDASVLTWDMWYTNHAGVFNSTAQYLAVTIRDPLDDSILETLFKTEEGLSPDSIPMTSFSRDISAYAGTTVRLDIESAQLYGSLDAAFDNFAVESAITGGKLFMVDGNNSTIYELDPSTGAVVNSFTTPTSTDDGGDGLAYGNGRMFFTTIGTNIIYEIDPSDGAILNQFTGPPTWEGIDALGFGGDKLYALEYGENATIHVLSPDTGANITTLEPGIPLGGGLTFAGTYGSLFVSNRGGEQLPSFGMTNRGFEYADFTGWNVYTGSAGDAWVDMKWESANSTNYTAAGGGYFALLQNGAQNESTYMGQNFTVGAGDMIQGWAFFSTTENPIQDPGFNDQCSVDIMDGATLVERVFYADTYHVNWPDTPWTYWSWTANSTGTYTLVARVVNIGDEKYPSYMGLDIPLEQPSTIYEINAETGAVLNSFPAPAGSGFGLYGLGFSSARNTLFLGFYESNMIYEVDPDTGWVINSFAGPEGTAISALAADECGGFIPPTTNMVTVEAEGEGSPLAVPIDWSWDSNGSTNTTLFDVSDIPDGTELSLTAPAMHTQNYTLYVFDHWSVGATDYDQDDVDITLQVNEDLTAVAHYALAGGKLFMVDGYNSTIYELDPSTGAVVNNFSTPVAAGGCDGLAYGNGRMFFAACGYPIYEIDPSDGSIINQLGPPKVAVYGAQGSLWNADVQAKLNSTGLFSQVDVFSANASETLPTPTLSELQEYDAVLVYSDYDFADNDAMGDVLADYIDAGGGVVIATFAFYDSAYAYGIGGRISTGGYLPFTQGTTQGGGTNLTLVADDPEHPILSGVTSFNGGLSSLYNDVTLASEAYLVGNWSDGAPLIAVKQMAEGAGCVVGLNFFPVSSDSGSVFWDSSTDGDLLMANSLVFVASNYQYDIDALGFSGDKLYALEYGYNATIHVLDPDTGANITTLQPSIPLVGGLTFAGSRNSLFASDADNSTIYEIDAQTGAALNSFSAPAGPGEGLLGLGFSSSRNTLFLGFEGTAMIYEVDPDDGTVINSFQGPEGTEITALAADECGVTEELNVECDVSPNPTTTGRVTDFTAEASGGVGDYSWSWTVNGTEIATTQNTTYIFASAGNYTVCVNVTDSLDNNMQCCKNVMVNPPLSLECDVSPNPTTAGQVTNFTAEATGGVGDYSWLWTINGTEVATTQNTTYIFASAGNYTVCVNVTDFLENSMQCCKNVTVNSPLSLECDISPNPTAVGDVTNFTAEASGGVGDYSWLWTVNGTEVATTQNTTYIFASAGNYTVCVNVTDSLDNDMQCCKNVTVTCELPTADFSGSPRSGGANLTVVFTDLSTGNATGWSWEFGDGSNSTAQNPSHDYTSVGNYTVSLTISNGCGSDTEIKVDYIGVAPSSEANTVTVEAEAEGNSLAVPVHWSWDSKGSTNTTSFGIENIPDGTELSLTAPATHTEDYTFYVFDHWSVGATDYGPGDVDITFEVSEGLTAIAHYTPIIAVDKTLDRCDNGTISYPFDPNALPLKTHIYFGMSITVEGLADGIVGVRVEDGMSADLSPIYTSGPGAQAPTKMGKGKAGGTKCVWILGSMDDGDTDTLYITAWTGTNAKGKQQYVSAGEHMLNSGPRVLFTYGGKHYTLLGPSITVNVVA